MTTTMIMAATAIKKTIKVFGSDRFAAVSYLSTIRRQLNHELGGKIYRELFEEEYSRARRDFLCASKGCNVNNPFITLMETSTDVGGFLQMFNHYISTIATVDVYDKGPETILDIVSCKSETIRVIIEDGLVDEIISVHDESSKSMPGNLFGRFEMVLRPEEFEQEIAEISKEINEKNLFTL